MIDIKLIRENPELVKENIKKNKKIKSVRNDVVKLCMKFPLYPGFDILR